jgi:hypothetical protein
MILISSKAVMLILPMRALRLSCRSGSISSERAQG